jgi:hypothetical protein
MLVGAAQAQDFTTFTTSQLAAKGTTQLSGPQISTLLLGNTAYILRLGNTRTAPQGAMVINYFPNARTRINSTASRKFEATWWIDGNQYCTEYKMAKTGHVCSTLYRLGSDTYVCEAGEPLCEWRMRLIPGNPENL